MRALREPLIKALIQEDARYNDLVMPTEACDQERLLRALLNVRAPKPASANLLEMQDRYLQAIIAQRGVTDAETLHPAPCDSRLFMWQGDITTLKVDAIVNAANSAMLGCFVPNHGCIDNAIHTFAGIQLRLACDRLMQAQSCPEPTGQAKITPAFNLPSRYVLHTVGPIIEAEVTDADRGLLAGCYRACLELAADHGLTSVAFCCISTGEFHFPNEEAACIAVETVRAFLQNNTQIEKVIINVFKDIDASIYARILGANCSR